MKKNLIFLIAFLCFFPAQLIYSQELIYTISGEFNEQNVALDSILFENLDNETSLLFSNLPEQYDYRINLTQGENLGATGISEIHVENNFSVGKNIPGQMVIHINNYSVEMLDLTIYNVQGQALYFQRYNSLNTSNAIDIKLGKPGVYFIHLQSPYGLKTYKALGANQNGLLDVTLGGDQPSQKKNFDSQSFNRQSDFSFQEGDSIRISVYKADYYSPPRILVIENSQAVAFILKESMVNTFGVSDGYVLVEEDTETISYDETTGQVTIRGDSEAEDIIPGNVITIDADTTGFLRKVVSVNEADGELFLETEQAYMNDIFVNTNLKLNTRQRTIDNTLKSKATVQELMQALTDEKGYIHPVEIIYYDENNISRKKSAFEQYNSEEDPPNIIDVFNDFSGKDLYGKSGDNIHFYIDQGHVSLVSDAIFELDFGIEGEITEDTKVKKGDLKSFTFYLDTDAEFLTKLALDISNSVEKSDTKTIFDFHKVTAKFIVPPGIPVWITFDCDVMGAYEFSADASLHADWGFQSIHNLKIGAEYQRAGNTFEPIKEYTPWDTIFPLNIEGEINAAARLELYPRFDMKFYNFFGPFAEVVPYVSGNYNARMHSVITPQQTETFLAWNSGIDIGLDFRVGAEMTFLGLIDREFGPAVAHCFDKPIWKTPQHLELITQLPEKSTGGSTHSLNFKVTDMFGWAVPLCPVYIEGDGTFSKYIAFTDLNGEVNVDWTLGYSAGLKGFKASIYNADETVAADLNMQIEVEEPVLKKNVALLVVNKNSLNAYDNGFVNVLNTIHSEYTIIDINDITSGTIDLSDFGVVISNIMGYDNASLTYFESIESNILNSLAAGTEYIVGSESGALVVALDLAEGYLNPPWGPALNDTRALTTKVTSDHITTDVDVMPNFEDYLGQHGSMLSSYFGDGVFWKVMSSYSGNFYRVLGPINYYPVHRFLGIWSGWKVSAYQSGTSPKEYVANHSRIMELGRFWTINNETKSHGWIGPEGFQVLSNTLDRYLNSHYETDNPGSIGSCSYQVVDGKTEITWSRTESADYYEIWQTNDDKRWGVIGMIPQTAEDNYSWTSPLTDSRTYKIRAVLDDTPGAFSDIEAE